MSKFLPVYLLRKGNPDYLVRRFLASAFSSNQETPQRLILLLKGFRPDERPADINRLPGWIQNRLDYITINDEGLDLTAYRKLCEQSSESHFLFFNSHSQLLHPDWHAAFEKAFDATKGEGLIGASGSYETGEMTDFVFPNPHIRTNGFLVGREAYLEAASHPLESKSDCHFLESGKNSLTRYFIEHEKPVLVVNSDGDLFESADWPNSQTFRLEDQQKLLVGDNRSQKYHLAMPNRRQFHAKASWGDQARIQSIPFFKTAGRIVWNRWFGNGYKFPILNALLESKVEK